MPVNLRVGELRNECCPLTHTVLKTQDRTKYLALRGNSVVDEQGRNSEAEPKSDSGVI